MSPSDAHALRVGERAWQVEVMVKGRGGETVGSARGRSDAHEGRERKKGSGCEKGGEGM